MKTPEDRMDKEEFGVYPDDEEVEEELGNNGDPLPPNYNEDDPRKDR